MTKFKLTKAATAAQQFLDDYAEALIRYEGQGGKLNALARLAGVAARLHDLRHTFGSWAVMEGIPLRTVQILMGHQDSRTTEIYAHLSQDHLETAAQKIRIGEK